MPSAIVEPSRRSDAAGGGRAEGAAGLPGGEGRADPPVGAAPARDDRTAADPLAGSATVAIGEEVHEAGGAVKSVA